MVFCMSDDVEFERTEVRKGGFKKGGWMNWKVLVAVLAIAGIGVLLLQTEQGRGYLSYASGFLGSGVGNFVSGFGKSDQAVESFSMSLNADSSALLGQSYTVANTSLDVGGLCSGPLRVGNVALHVEGTDCKIDLNGMRGDFSYTKEGALSFDGEASEVISNGNRITTGDDASTYVHVTLNVVPKAFLLTNFAQDTIDLSAVKGGLDRLNQDGSVKSHEEMAEEQLKIGSFAGFIKLEGSTINMRGIASSVRGSDPHSSFAW
jgi:hypothetical protein